MKLDLEQTIETLLPWDCQIKFRGTWHKVRPPVLADVDTLMQITTGKSLTEVGTAALIGHFFEEPKPNFDEMSIAEFSLVAQAVSAYIGDYISKKNQQKLLLAIGLGGQNATPPGTSSPPSANAIPAASIQ